MVTRRRALKMAGKMRLTLEVAMLFVIIAEQPRITM